MTTRQRFTLITAIAIFIVIASVGAALLVRRRAVELGIIPGVSPAMPSVSPGFVLIKNYSFIPNRVLVTKGETVTWVNEDDVTHTISAEALGGQHIIAPGKTFSFKTSSIIFPSGEISYHCDLHPHMRGTLLLKATNASPGAFRMMYEGLAASQKECMQKVFGDRLIEFLEGVITQPTEEESAGLNNCLNPKPTK